jgi:hypothetical protein
MYLTGMPLSIIVCPSSAICRLRLIIYLGQRNSHTALTRQGFSMLSALRYRSPLTSLWADVQKAVIDTHNCCPDFAPTILCLKLGYTALVKAVRYIGMFRKLDSHSKYMDF